MQTLIFIRRQSKRRKVEVSADRVSHQVRALEHSNGVRAPLSAIAEYSEYYAVSRELQKRVQGDRLKRMPGKWYNPIPLPLSRITWTKRRKNSDGIERENRKGFE